MSREADEEDYRRERIEAWEAERNSKCRCSRRDWPGFCPGPAFCPLCELPEYDLCECGVPTPGGKCVVGYPRGCSNNV